MSRTTESNETSFGEAVLEATVRLCIRFWRLIVLNAPPMALLLSPNLQKSRPGAIALLLVSMGMTMWWWRIRRGRLRGTIAGQGVERRFKQAMASGDSQILGWQVDTEVRRSVRVAWSEVVHACSLAPLSPEWAARELRQRRDSWRKVTRARDFVSRGRRYRLVGSKVFAIPRILSEAPCALGPVFTAELLHGFDPEHWKARANTLAANFGVLSVRIDQDDAEREARVVRITMVVRDPLARGTSSEVVPAGDQLRQLQFGIGEDGRPRSLDLRNISGVVVGGVPGSGKTAAMTALVSGLLTSESVALAVIDGKGGTDWDWVEPRASLFAKDGLDDLNLVQVIDGIVDLMRYRLATQKDLRGSSNFWDLPLSPSSPAVILLIDECQTIFDMRGPSKENRDRASHACAQVEKLVRLGRAAGIITILMTQKPTVDSLPSAIRDNASLRVAFRVATSAAEESILGDAARTSSVRATEIAPNMRGVAVVADPDGALERVRFGFIPENRAADLAEATANKRPQLSGEREGMVR